MTATDTTIHDVWVYTKQRRRKPAVFDLSLSPTGIVVIRPGRAPQRLSWDRISNWEIEKRQGYALLTLSGGGSSTKLVVTGWSVEDLDRVIARSRHRPPEAAAPGATQTGARATKAPGATKTPGATKAAGTTKAAGATKAPGTTKAAGVQKAAGATKAAGAQKAPGTTKAAGVQKAAGATKAAGTTKAAGAQKAAGAAKAPGAAKPPGADQADQVDGATARAGSTKSTTAPSDPAASPATRSDEPGTAVHADDVPGSDLADALGPEPYAWQRLPWKPIATVVLLGVVAFAVIVVLLQSAGIINWGILGPTA